MMRQKREQMLTFTNPARLFIIAAIIILFASLARGEPLTIQNEYVTDPLTGVALDGYDAISYYTQKEPILGLPEYELIWSGVSWYFSNEANRAVFVRAPQIYAPQFGGHGTMGLARGYLSDGNPNIFAILGCRLFLFYSTSNKDAFMLAQKPAYIKANNNWQFLSSKLVPAE